MSTIFTPAHILLPDGGSDAYARFAVIACDQFTSEPDYWRAAEAAVGGAFSALDLILPEVYLGTPEEARRSVAIREAMLSAAERLQSHPDSLVYLERTLPDGSVRRGLVGKIDLAAYDYSPDSASPIRPTEATVTSRIPPRVAIRREATVELPHVMLLMDDPTDAVLAAAAKSASEPIYDFSLMLGGGHARGYLLTGQALETTLAAIAAYEASREGVVYAVGDGNHSLASAAAYYREQGDLDSPARYALVELVNLHDPALEFEPIYRLLKNCDPDDVLAALSAAGTSEITVPAVTTAGERQIPLPRTHALTVGSLQEWIDAYIAAHPGTECDYIHGEDALRTLAREDGCVGFLCNGIEKAELFPYVTAHGPLPRKTFSMGEAKSKRYYIEARKIR